MNFKRTIDVVTTTADYVETAKDIKDGKGITGFDVILDIVRIIFKAIAKVVKWLFKAIGFILKFSDFSNDNKNTEKSEPFEIKKNMLSDIERAEVYGSWRSDAKPKGF